MRDILIHSLIGARVRVRRRCEQSAVRNFRSSVRNAGHCSAGLGATYFAPFAAGPELEWPGMDWSLAVPLSHHFTPPSIHLTELILVPPCTGKVF